MLSKKQARNFNRDCAQWLECFLKKRLAVEIEKVHDAGKTAGYSRAQIKAARAWHGKWIVTMKGLWGWNL